MGLITRDEAAGVDAVRKVRNVFAHEMEASFDHPAVKKLCSKAPIYDGRLCDRDAFFHIGMNTTYPLLYRIDAVKRKWRRNELTMADSSELMS